MPDFNDLASRLRSVTRRLTAAEITTILEHADDDAGPVDLLPAKAGVAYVVERAYAVVVPGPEQIVFSYTGDTRYFRVGCVRGVSETPWIDGTAWSDVMFHNELNDPSVEAMLPEAYASFPSARLVGLPLSVWCNAPCTEIAGDSDLIVTVLYREIEVPT